MSSADPAPRADTSALIATSTEDIAKPDLDQRQYRHLRLKNRLQIVLVSDAACGERAPPEKPIAVHNSASHT